MSEPVLRVAEVVEDVALVAQLFRAYGDHLSTVADICVEDLDREIATLPRDYFLMLLAMVDENPAGCAALKLLARPDEHACELKRLWVSPAFRGQQLGKRLMEEAVSRAARLGFTAIYLDTAPVVMPHANRIYQDMGFERTDRYNANPVADIVFFRLPLPVASGPRESR